MLVILIRRFKLIRKFFNSDMRGLTLIELLLASVVLVIFLAISYPFYSYATKSIDIATKQQVLQQNVLLAKELIGSQKCKIRFSDCLTILKSAPVSPGEEGCAGFVNAQELYVTESGMLMHTTQDGIPEELLWAIAEDTYFTLAFEKSGPKLLKYTIHGEYGGQEYELSSEIAITNLEEIQEEEAGSQGVAIRYAFRDN
jgi:prepilin-type N-terminal cleavage/methylation domain-containing protein